MTFDVLPLRAIVFQILLLLMAIILEAIVFRRLLDLDYKTSTQYSITANLLSTVIGWVIFFNVQSLLPMHLQSQLISYVFFERFLSNTWETTILPALIITSLAIFLGTFLIKLEGLNLLEFLLKFKPGEKKDSATDTAKEGAGRLRFVKHSIGFRVNSKTYAVLVANACSFSAILFLLLVRLIGHGGGLPI
jgi:hypothetical protein